MRLTTIAFLAALIPVSAAAGPNKNNNTDNKPDEVEVDTYEWSTSHDGRLGVMVMGLNPELRAYFGAPEDSGMLVAGVAKGSPAARAGLRVGDVITKFGNDKVDSADDILSALSAMASTRKTSIDVVRDHKPLTVQVTFAPRNEPAPHDTI